MINYKTSEEIVRELDSLKFESKWYKVKEIKQKAIQEIKNFKQKLWLSKEELKKIIGRIDNLLVDSLEYPQQKYAFLLHKEDWKKLKKELMLE